MKRIVINIATSVITTLIGFYVGRQSKVEELKDKVRRQVLRAETAKAQSRHYQEEYRRLAVAKPQYMKIMNELKEIKSEVRKTALLLEGKASEDLMEVINSFSSGYASYAKSQQEIRGGVPLAQLYREYEEITKNWRMDKDGYVDDNSD